MRSPNQSTRGSSWSYVPLAAALLVTAACETPVSEFASTRRDFGAFRSTVYPVLLRDCGFPACHGDPGRFFRVWGPGRTRLPGSGSTPEAFDLPTGDELSSSYSLVLSFVNDESPADSELLRKPLAPEAGGISHGGVDPYGRNIYRTAQDGGFVALAAWVYERRQQLSP